MKAILPALASGGKHYSVGDEYLAQDSAKRTYGDQHIERPCRAEKRRAQARANHSDNFNRVAQHHELCGAEAEVA